MTASETNGTCAYLAEMQIYRDYCKAYTEATGLPLRLRDATQTRSALELGKGASPFCLLIARTNTSCQACLAMQQRVEREAHIKPKTLKCFAGLCETAVPVRVGENLVAWLETGHVLVDHPTRSKFIRTAKTLLRWGTDADLKRIEEAYFNTRVISRSQYESAVRLLQIFAGHLAEIGQQIALQGRQNEPIPVSKARQWIVAHYENSVSLASAARAVNLSAKYFSDIFRKATGIPFVEYVGRIRVEKAKSLLTNPQLRISEIAFEVGFQSLSQFNRAFRRHAGTSPRDYRHAIPRFAKSPQKSSACAVRCVESHRILLDLPATFERLFLTEYVLGTAFMAYCPAFQTARISTRYLEKRAVFPVKCVAREMLSSDAQLWTANLPAD